MAAASNPRTSSSGSKEHRCSICIRVFDSAEMLNSHKGMEHSQEGYQSPAGVR